MTMNNKQIVTTAYQRIFGDLDASAVDEYMSKDFIQHNPTTPDGPEGVKQLLEMLTSRTETDDHVQACGRGRRHRHGAFAL